MAALTGPLEIIAPLAQERAPWDRETPEKYVSHLALAKVHQVVSRAAGAIVVSADTAVVIDDEILGKPASPTEANRMLRLLRGRTHTALTGITVVDLETARWRSSVKRSHVAMRRYSDVELSDYVATGKPFDKAGGYAVQDPVFKPAQGVEGCYLNVVGLPLCETISLLQQSGYPSSLKRSWQPPAECRDCPLGQYRGAARA